MLNSIKSIIVDDKSVFDNPLENWVAGGTIPEARNKFYPAEIQYNQREVDDYSCTLHAVCTAISSLKGKVFSLEERAKLWKDLIEKKIARSGWGAVTSRVVNYMYKYENFNDEEKINYFTTEFLSDQFWQVMEAGYTCVIGGAINRNYHNDYFDGKLDNIAWSKPTYGHVFCITLIKDGIFLVENYDIQGRVNVVEMTKKELKQLRNQQSQANKIYFYNSAYYFMYEKEWQNADIKVSTWAEVAKEKAIKKGIITDWKNPKDKIAGERTEFILEKLGLLDKNQHEGFVTLEQFAVVLDRLKLLD